MSKKDKVKDSGVYGYIQNIASEAEKRDEFVLQYLKPLLHNGIGTILRNIKKKGYSSFSIVQFLSFLPLLGLRSINGCYTEGMSELMPVGKDVFYRFKNNEWIPWRKILYSISRRFLKLSKESEQLDEQSQKSVIKPTCFIFDDTDLGKTGTSIEGVSKVWSHLHHCQILGFKCLAGLFFDGVSAIPIDFSLHREGKANKKKQFGLKKKELDNQYTKQRAANSAGARRKTELDSSKIVQVIVMLTQAIRQGLKAEYVLTDSWFFCEQLLRFTLGKGMDLISGVKMGKFTFHYNGKDYPVKSLLNITKSKAKYCRKLKAHYISLIVSYKGMEVRLFFIRYGNQKKWRVIVCSNTKLTFIKMMEIYQIRWSIEVFFKEMKQYLGIQKCQSRDFDAHIAHISLGMISYMALALKKRVEGHQTIGQLFRAAKAQVLELTIAQKVWNWFLKIIQDLTDLFDFDPKELFQRLNEPSIFNRFSFIFKE